MALLSKIRETGEQNKLARKERLKNLRGAFKAGDDAAGKKIILFDDVFTTGTTMNEASKALKEAGAESIAGLVIARSS